MATPASNPRQEDSSSAAQTTAKRKRNDVTSPDALILQQSKKVDICGHCNKKCTDKGPLSEAIQCDLCHCWVHATCEGLKKDQYKLITQLTSLVDNLVYYCKLNQCAVINKRLLHDHFSYLTQSTDVPTILAMQAEQTNLHRIITETSAKVDALSFSQYPRYCQ